MSFCATLSQKFSNISSKIKQTLENNNSKINSLFSWFLIAYFTLNFSLYFLEGIPFVGNITKNIFFTYGVKLFSYILCLTYIFCFIIGNKIKLTKIVLLIPFAIIICGFISSVFISRISDVLIVNSYDHRLIFTFNAGILDSIVGIVGSLIDLIWLLSFVFVFRKRISKNDILPFLKFVVFFTIAEFLYSLILEFNVFKLFISGIFDGNMSKDGLNGTFISKNGLGFLLFQSIVACWSILIISKKYLYIVPLFLFHLYALISMCRTSFASIIILDILLGIFGIIYLFKKKRKFFNIAIAIISVFIVFVVLSFIPNVNTVQPFSFIKKVFDSVFYSSGSGSIVSDRESIWHHGLSLIRGPFGFFGYGRNNAADILEIVSGYQTRTFHNAYLDLIAMYGVIGLFVFSLAVVLVYKNDIEHEKTIGFKALMFATLFGSLIYGLFENTIILFTSSCVMFVSNVLLSTSNSNMNPVEKDIPTVSFKGLPSNFKSLKLSFKIMIFADLILLSFCAIVVNIFSITPVPSIKLIFFISAGAYFIFKFFLSLFIINNKLYKEFGLLLLITELTLMFIIYFVFVFIDIGNVNYLMNNVFTYELSIIVLACYLIGIFFTDLLICNDETN